MMDLLIEEGKVQLVGLLSEVQKILTKGQYLLFSIFFLNFLLIKL